WRSRTAAAPCSPPRSLFFSSRRRHTRSKRDWSSDVCSSDLDGVRLRQAIRPGQETVLASSVGGDLVREVQGVTGAVIQKVAEHRSEERRVGKECRWQWSAWAWREEDGGGALLIGVRSLHTCA